MTARIERSALVRCSCAEMYALITAIERYPEFVPSCRGATILCASVLDGESAPAQSLAPSPGAAQPLQPASEVVATLDVERRGFRETLTTRNRCWPGERVELTLVDGPLKFLEGVWLLQPLGELGCEVRLEIEYEFRRGLNVLGRAFAGSVGRVADDILDAFCRRAEAG